MAGKSIIFHNLRTVWVSLSEPKAFKEGQKAKYSVKVIFPKTDKVTLKKFTDFLESNVNANGNWKEQVKKQVISAAKKTITDEGRNKNCVICDGDLLNEQALAEDQKLHAEYTGMYVVNFTRPASFGAPLVCRQDKTEIPAALIPSEIPAGYFVNLDASAYVYDTPVGRGVSFQFSAVQLAKKGEQFGRQNNFDAIEVDEESEESFAE